MIDEKELMLKVKNGQLGCLSNLFEGNRLGLFNFFLKMGINRALSEDLVQETFMKVLAYRGTYKAQSSFKAWLYRIARNSISDHFRKMANHDIHDVFDEEAVLNEVTLVETIEIESKQSLFEKALQALPAEQREIIILSRFQQLNYADIAELFECNINTLKTRMQTAISQLKTQYQILNGEVAL